MRWNCESSSYPSGGGGSEEFVCVLALEERRLHARSRRASILLDGTIERQTWLHRVNAEVVIRSRYAMNSFGGMSPVQLGALHPRAPTIADAAAVTITSAVQSNDRDIDLI